MQISEKKLAANRANGALSRGPVTPEGKARSAQNARTHGLLSSIAALRAENKEAFDVAVQAYFDRFQPADEFELALVEDMAAASWHIRRAFAIETNMLDVEMDACTTARTEIDRLTTAFGNLAGTPKLNTIHRYQTRLHNRHSRTLRDFILLRKALPPSSPVPNEPKTPFPFNESLPGEPTQNGACHEAAIGSEPSSLCPAEPPGQPSTTSESVPPSDIVNTSRRTASMLHTRGLPLLFAAVTFALAQNAPRQLTARELFYAANPAATAPAKPAPAKSTAPPKATTPRPVHTTPKPVEIAVATTHQDAGVKVIPTASHTAPLPANGQPPLGLRINILRYNSDGTTTDALPDTIFHSGDRIRFNVEPNAPGFLYIANQGASGTWKAMFPSPEIEGGDNRVEAMHPTVVPPGNRVFAFDTTAGNENLFVVFSRQPVSDFEDLIYSLRNKQPAANPETAPRDKNLIMATNIGDPIVDRLRSAYGRDLIIETVNTAAPGEKKDTAVYVVNPTGSPDSRVVADIKLVHE